jgi:hypothetical protein
MAVRNGKIYWVGAEWNGDRDNPKYQACYWVDGVRYELNGSGATAIFVEE